MSWKAVGQQVAALQLLGNLPVHFREILRLRRREVRPASDLRHAPSCATTLIVSLGLLSGLLQSGVIVAAVALLFATQAVLDPGERMVYILTNLINRIN